MTIINISLAELYSGMIHEHQSLMFVKSARSTQQILQEWWWFWKRTISGEVSISVMKSNWRRYIKRLRVITLLKNKTGQTHRWHIPQLDYIKHSFNGGNFGSLSTSELKKIAAQLGPLILVHSFSGCVLLKIPFWGEASIECWINDAWY